MFSAYNIVMERKCCGVVGAPSRRTLQIREDEAELMMEYEGDDPDDL